MEPKWVYRASGSAYDSGTEPDIIECWYATFKRPPDAVATASRLLSRSPLEIGGASRTIRSMYVIGLTGAIAVGKSTVARTLLAAKGAAIIDGDQVVHTLYAYNRALVARIVARFGPAMLTPDGSLDRAALGRTVFPDPVALADLERLVYPYVLAEQRRLLARARRRQRTVAVLDAVKLVESGAGRLVDELWIVTAPAAAQRRRLQDRGLDDDAIALLAWPPSSPGRTRHTGSSKSRRRARSSSWTMAARRMSWRRKSSACGAIGGQGPVASGQMWPPYGPPLRRRTGRSLPCRNGGGLGWGSTHYRINLPTLMREGAG